TAASPGGKAAVVERSGGRASSALALGDLVGQLRGDLEQVTHDTEVGDLEDRGLGVLVDGDDGLRRLHAGAVLDRTGDAQCDVQLRRHRLAGLADLELRRVVAGVDGGTRGTDGGTERVGQLLDDLELVRRAHTAATGDDDRRLRQLRPVAADDRL